MSNLIKRLNDQYLDASLTHLSNDLVAGTNVALVQNHNNIPTSWAVQIGETGAEKSEVLIVSGTPAGGTVNLTANTRFAHSADTPVYCYKYDQVVFSVSTTGTAGTVTPLTGGTVTITPDRFDRDNNSYTVFDDTSGSASYTYKTKLYNSVLTVSTDNSDWIYPDGQNTNESYSLSKLRSRAKNKLLNSVDDSVVDEWINEWHESMTNGLIEINRDYAIGTTNVAFSAGQQYGTITDNDFKLPRRVQLIDASGTGEVFPQELTDNKPNNNNFTKGRDTYYFRGDTVIGRDPYTNAGTLQIEFYKLNPQMSDDTDTLPLPMRGYTRSYIKYVQAQAAYLDNKESQGERFEAQAEALRTQFMNEMSPRQQDGPEYVKVTTPYEKIL